MSKTQPTAPPAAPPAPPRPVGAGMSTAARWGVLGLLLVVVGGHAAAAVASAEWWPLSHYALYAKKYTWRDRLVPVAEGLTAAGAVVPMNATNLSPLDDGRVERKLRKTIRGRMGPEEQAQRGAVIAAGFGRLYEHNRRAGLHDGPPLAAVRLVWETRRVHPDARNARGPADARAEVVRVATAPDGGAP